jgi:hypothetical protein
MSREGFKQLHNKTLEVNHHLKIFGGKLIDFNRVSSGVAE